MHQQAQCDLLVHPGIARPNRIHSFEVHFDICVAHLRIRPPHLHRLQPLFLLALIVKAPQLLDVLEDWVPRGLATGPEQLLFLLRRQVIFDLEHKVARGVLEFYCGAKLTRGLFLR